MSYTTRETCRLCDGNLETVISLGDIYLSTFLATNEQDPPKIPIELTLCQDCKLAQLRHTVNPDVMYRQYWYQSSLNVSMQRALRNVVAHVKEHITLQPGDIVVDIGSNDGTLLSNYDDTLVKVGFEPSNVANDLAAPSEIIHTYFSHEAYFERFAPKAKVITAIAMFYDLENPHQFVHGLKKVLADDGVLVIQMMDLLSMFKYLDFPNLCHEHLEYYSLDVLYKLLQEHGLTIFDLEYNGVNGGSLRVYARHATGLPVTAEKVRIALDAEKAYFQSLGDPYAYFRTCIERVKQSVVTFIRTQRAQGSRIAVMGASTKGNTTLQYFGLDENDIDHAAEVNPDKFGLRTVGTHIPIISEHESLMRKPDYYLILPWGFIDTFIEKNRDYLANGGTFIVPLPKPRRLFIGSSGETIEWLM